MKYAIIADVHSNLEAFLAILDTIDSLGVDEIICLGDVVGYNANPNGCIELVRQRNIRSILGNHDAVACGKEEPWWFNEAARDAALWTRKELTPENMTYLAELPDELVFEDGILASHGSPSARDDYIIEHGDTWRHFQNMASRKIDICFFGHSHLPRLFSFRGPDHDLEAVRKHALNGNNHYLINPGAVGQPRDGDWMAAFGVFDSEELSVEFFRISYDVQRTSEKVRALGLDPFLANRLLHGM